MSIKPEIIQGDSVAWIESTFYDDLRNSIDSTSGWTLAINIAGPAVLSITGSAYGSGWSFNMTSTQSQTLTPGDYYWQLVATKASNKITVNRGTLKVTPSTAGASAGFDGRSQTKIDLDNVQLAIRNIIAGGAVSQYKIGTREVQKMSMSELIALESKLKYRYKLEERERSMSNGQGDPFTLKVRF